jgi:hypothetical protein
MKLPNLILCCLVFVLNITFAQNKSNEKLKAVLIVGPQEASTSESIAGMKKIATLLKSEGVEVHSFFNKNTDWNKIKKAAKGASILVYDGHGNENYEFILDKVISKEKIATELKLKKNALVLFQSVCYGAGSSAGDVNDIGIIEAEKRILNYAKIFVNNGVGCYFAINTVGGAHNFLEDFFEGNTIKQCFSNSTKYIYEVEKLTKSSINPDFILGIASINLKGKATVSTISKIYNIAFVSIEDFNINSLLNSR